MVWVLLFWGFKGKIYDRLTSGLVRFLIFGVGSRIKLSGTSPLGFGVSGPRVHHYSEKKNIFQACDCCGDYHFKRMSAGADHKLNLLVHQINIKTDVIKQNMDNVWAKLAALEATFTGMLTKIYRLPSQRDCLEMLSEEPGDGYKD